MKNGILFIVMMAAGTSLFAQSSNSALGIRFGGSDGVGAEISFQQFVGGPNRFEADLGFYNEAWKDGFKFTLLYQWVHQIDGGLNWYVGVGGSMGSWDVNEGNTHWDNDEIDGFFLDLDGTIGMEYHFDIPLMVSLDLRPEFGLINDGFDMGFGLGVRYEF